MFLNVLSLFDGISCGRLALERAGISVEKYYASEIENNAIKISQSNYPDIIQLGDVRNINPDQFDEPIDLLLSGSPCTNFSFSGKRNGMVTEENVVVDTLEQYLKLKSEGVVFSGQSYLFWEFVRLLHELKPRYFLMENVVMHEKWENIITKTLGVTPIKINSALVSAQNRERLYWTNIPGITQPENKNISLVDILEDTTFTSPAAIRGRNIYPGTIVGRRLDENGSRKDDDHRIPIIQCLEVRKTNTTKSNCLTTVEKDNVLTPLPVGRYPDAFGKYNGTPLQFRYYTRREYERLQTVPDGYTDAVPESAAKKALGNAWTVDVIAHIFSFLQKGGEHL